MIPHVFFNYIQPFLEEKKKYQMTFRLWIVNKLFAWTVSSLLLTTNQLALPCFWMAETSRNLEKRSILIKAQSFNLL